MTMAEHVHVFVYDATPFDGIATERVRDDVVSGTLFHVEGVGPALMLSGQSRVRGSVRLLDPDALARVDRAARVAEGIYRRVGVLVGDTPCWTWVAGPQLAQRLATARTRATESS